MTTNCVNAANPVGIASGGTGAITKAAAFNALAPTPSAVGDMCYWDGTNWVLVAAPIAITVPKVLTISLLGGAPTWI